MIKHNQDGAASGLAISEVLTVTLLIAAIAFGIWAFSSRQDYKNNTDAKINTAVTVAKKQEGAVKDAQFAQEEKNPLKTYSGPQAYGSIVLQYPKTWSGYVAVASGNSSGNGNGLVDGYFDPGVVPATDDQASVFALRIQVISQSYSQTMTTINSSLQEQNAPTVNAYALPKVPQAVGVKVTGALPGSDSGSSNPQTGTMVVLPLRSQTLEIWTEGDQFQSDFNNIILPNFTFSP